MSRLGIRLLFLLAISAPLLGCDARNDQYRYAMKLVLSGTSASGARMLSGLATSGHAPSQFRLGLLYKLGKGVPRDLTRAAYWFDQAARQDDLGGQYELAEAYLRGDGVPASPSNAFSWFHRLAERGFAPAQYQVAQAYAKGRGIARDDRQSVIWLERAAKGGHHEAARQLALAYRNGLLGLPRDPEQATAWEQTTQPPRF